MIKKAKIVSLLFLFVWMLCTPVASAKNLQGNLVHQNMEEKQVGDVQLQYNKYPISHYELDTWIKDAGSAWQVWNWGEMAGNQLYAALSTLVNGIWSLNEVFSYFVGYIVEQAFSLDFVEDVVYIVGNAIQTIAGFDHHTGAGPASSYFGFTDNGLWPQLVLLMIVLVGTWATWTGIVKRETNRALGGLLSSMIIFALSLGFFAYAGDILKAFNDWSSDLQEKVLNISANVVTPAQSYTENEGVASIRNQIFEIMSYKPYLLMQYGTADEEQIKSEGQNRIDNILKLDPISQKEERQELVQGEFQNYDNTMMSIDGVTQRAAFVPLLFLANIILGIMILLMAAAIFFYQFFFLALVLIAPVPLLIALIPRFQTAAVNWAMKALHALIMKIGIALLLTIIFTISGILYRAANTADYGFIGMLFFQILCFVGIWLKRHDLFAVVSAASNNLTSHARDITSHRGYRDRIRQAQNTYRRARHAGRKKLGASMMATQTMSFDKNNRHMGLVDRQQRERGAEHTEKNKGLANQKDRRFHLVDRQAKASQSSQKKDQDQKGTITPIHKGRNQTAKIPLVNRLVDRRNQHHNGLSHEKSKKETKQAPTAPDSDMNKESKTERPQLVEREKRPSHKESNTEKATKRTKSRRKLVDRKRGDR